MLEVAKNFITNFLNLACTTGFGKIKSVLMVHRWNRTYALFGDVCTIYKYKVGSTDQVSLSKYSRLVFELYLGYNFIKMRVQRHSCKNLIMLNDCVMLRAQTLILTSIVAH